MPPAVALVNYLSKQWWYILADFLHWELGYFAGFFYIYVINFAVRISEAAMKGVGDIIFHNLGAQWMGTPSYCDLSRFFLYYSPQGSAKLRWAGRRSGDRI